MNFDYSFSTVRNALSWIVPTPFSNQCAKMGFATTAIFATVTTVCQAGGELIRQQIKQGAFSFDPVFREQMAAQLGKARADASRAGVLGFLGMAYVVICVGAAVIIIRESLKENAIRRREAPPALQPSRPVRQIEEDLNERLVPEKLQYKDPNVLLAILQNPDRRPLPDQAGLTFEAVYGVVYSASRNSQGFGEEQRTQLFQAFFLAYPALEPAFVAQSVLGRMRGVFHKEELPTVISAITCCKKIENHLKAAFDYAVSGMQLEYFHAILKRAPELKKELPEVIKKVGYDWPDWLQSIVETYRDDLKPSDMFCLVNLMNNKALFDHRAIQSLERITQIIRIIALAAGELEGDWRAEIKKWLKFVAEFQSVRLFKEVADVFKDKLKRDDFVEILAAENVPLNVKKWINNNYPVSSEAGPAKQLEIERGRNRSDAAIPVGSINNGESNSLLGHLFGPVSRFNNSNSNCFFRYLCGYDPVAAIGVLKNAKVLEQAPSYAVDMFRHVSNGILGTLYQEGESADPAICVNRVKLLEAFFDQYPDLNGIESDVEGFLIQLVNPTTMGADADKLAILSTVFRRYEISHQSLTNVFQHSVSTGNHLCAEQILEKIPEKKSHIVYALKVYSQYGRNEFAKQIIQKYQTELDLTDYESIFLEIKKVARPGIESSLKIFWEIFRALPETKSTSPSLVKAALECIVAFDYVDGLSRVVEGFGDLTRANFAEILLSANTSEEVVAWIDRKFPV